MKILIVDDERMSRRMLKAALRQAGHEVVEAENGLDALAVIAEQSIRFVITDWMMPRLDGVALTQRLRANADAPFVYVILVTAKENTAELIEAMNAGADDFIRKPFDQGELAVRVRAGVRILELTERLERQAMTDPLTGLLNRRGLEHAIEIQGLAQLGLGFIVGDLDHFKLVNDRHGHAAGDLVLRKTGALLRELFEPQGLVARVGGEEFWVLLRGCDQAALERRTENARRSIECTPFAVGNGQPLHLSMSFGCTQVDAIGDRDDRDDREVERLFRIADGALYHAKENGRNRVSFAAPSDRPEPDDGPDRPPVFPPGP